MPNIESDLSQPSWFLGSGEQQIHQTTAPAQPAEQEPREIPDPWNIMNGLPPADEGLGFLDGLKQQAIKTKFITGALIGQELGKETLQAVADLLNPPPEPPPSPSAVAQALKQAGGIAGKFIKWSVRKGVDAVKKTRDNKRRQSSASSRQEQGSQLLLEDPNVVEGEFREI